MKRLCALLVLILSLAACSQDKPAEEKAAEQKGAVESKGEVAAEQGGAPAAPQEEWHAKDFPAALEAARESVVRLGLPADSEAGPWLDAWLAPELKRRFGISLERVALDEAAAEERLLAEKKGGVAPGGVDLIWLDGPRFPELRRAGVLFGPFADKLPNVQAYVNRDLAARDAGHAVEGFAAPVGQLQYVFEYDSARLKNPPDSFPGLLDWLRKHPGRLAVPLPPDPTGSAFLRQAFWAFTGGREQYAGPFKEGLFRERVALFWSFFDELRPLLWGKGRSWPRDAAEASALLARGEVDLVLSGLPLHAQSRVLAKAYKDTARTQVFDEGSLARLRLAVIPFNAPNKPGAMVLADFLLSPEAQLAKFDPKAWGDFPAVDVSLLPAAIQKRFFAVKLGRATQSFGELGVTAMPDTDAGYSRALDRAVLARISGK